MTRTHSRFLQYYQNGYDLTGHTRSIGPLSWDADFNADSALNWEVKGGMIGQNTISVGQLNTIFNWDATATASPHDWITGMNGTAVNVAVPFGMMTTAAVGDPVFMATVMQKTSAVVSAETSMVTTTIDYEPRNVITTTGGVLLNYAQPWGKLVHAKGSETSANTAIGYDWGGATSGGSWMMCHIFSITGAGSVTITVQDAATNLNASFAAVTGLTTGAITNTTAPTSIIAQAATTAALRQFTRWQIAFTGSTACTFALSLVRGR